MLQYAHTRKGLKRKETLQELWNCPKWAKKCLVGLVFVFVTIIITTLMVLINTMLINVIFVVLLDVVRFDIHPVRSELKLKIDEKNEKLTFTPFTLNWKLKKMKIWHSPRPSTLRHECHLGGHASCATFVFVANFILHFPFLCPILFSCPHRVSFIGDLVTHWLQLNNTIREQSWRLVSFMTYMITNQLTYLPICTYLPTYLPTSL